MPTYEYECLECKHRFTVFQSMKDEPVKVCENCGKPVRKLFNAAGIIFKGNGFYVNDYKSKNAPSENNSVPACSGDCGSCGAQGGE
ncbi:MAG TPA: zinc ribbon domain-containing protein [Spirochaetota bacterium]|nr:zinc ribbon domain-containing protein [Spirochaetota bacterium]HPJ33929.1 zinc ribbon domain-containing protein [Spirochaetota bacterium]